MNPQPISLSINEFLILILVISIFTDFYLKNKDSTRYEIAFKFLQLSHWLKDNSWTRVQKEIVGKIYKLYQKIFGNKIISFRFLISATVLSLFLTTFAILLAMYFISPNELGAAGFRDLNTLYSERLSQFYLEAHTKKNILKYFYLLHLIFDLITIIISYSIVRSINKSNKIIKTIILSSLDFVISAVTILIVMSIVLLVSNTINLGIMTTSLLSQKTTLIFTVATIALPIFMFSFTLVFIALIRGINKIFEGFFSRFADESKTVFSQMGTLLSATLKLISISNKIYLLFLTFLLKIFNFIVQIIK